MNSVKCVVRLRPAGLTLPEIKQMKQTLAKWRQKLFSNIFLRNALASFGARKTKRSGAGELEQFFQFKIGRYQDDLYLHFPQVPYPLRYKNEIFNKLEEYSGHDVIRYLEFHYAAYSEKQDFLIFLYYEVSERLKRSPRQIGLLSAQDWIEQKRSELSRSKAACSEDSIEAQAAPEDKSDNSILVFQSKIEQRINSLLSEAETSMRGLANSFSTGNIELNNRNHEDKLIQLLVLVLQIKASNRAEHLFKKMNATDFAAILHLQFRP